MTLAFAAAAIGATGCGNVMTPANRYAPSDSYDTTSAATSLDMSDSGNEGSSGDFNCPDSNMDASRPQAGQVFPDYDWDLDNTGYYQVCSSKSSSSVFKIHGKTSASDTICFFPAMQQAGTTQVWKDATGKSYAQCVQATSDGAYVSLPPGMNPNSAFIVESPDEAQMHLCLEAAAPELCPKHWSFGKLIIGGGGGGTSSSQSGVPSGGDNNAVISAATSGR